MKKAYLHLIKYALKNGKTISVWDGEEWQLKKSSSYKAVKEAVESVDEAEMRFRDNGEYLGTAAVSLYDMLPDETVRDYTVCDFLNEWNNQYTEEIS